MQFRDTFVPIAKKLAAHGWTWDKSEIEKSLMSLGWKRFNSSDGRVDFEHISGYHASVYFDGARPEFIEVDIIVFADTESLDAIEYSEKDIEFYEGFFSATELLADALGKPAFSDGAAAKGFPFDQEAVWLSLWNFPSARFMLQQKHEDRELPFRICIVLTPPTPSSSKR